MSAKSRRIAPKKFWEIFHLEKSQKSQPELRFHFKPHERVSVGFCSFRSMMKLKMETFEKREKIEISCILGRRFASEAIFAQENFLPIFGIWSIFDRHMTRNLHFRKEFENTNIHVNHTSKWAKSDRNSLIWLKIKSERSSRKQHFFSHFEQFQLKMR